MARPGIVRADTLDLQDQENPTAAEHQRHPQSNGIAPHQASQVQHVMEERHSEEQALQQEVWGVTGQLNDDPNEHGQSNGQERADGDGGEGGDSEGEGDDDMMDRISSSPSIDDGGYFLSSSPPRVSRDGPPAWPARYSSLSTRSTTPISTRETFNQSANSSSDSSSPFYESPRHLPLRRAKATLADVSPLWPARETSSLFEDTPRAEVFAATHRNSISPLPSENHRLGRCAGQRADDLDPTFRDSTSIKGTGNYGFGCESDKGSQAPQISSIGHHTLVSQDLALEGPRIIESPFRRHSFSNTMDPHEDSCLRNSPVSSLSSSSDSESEALPMDVTSAEPSSPTGSSGSWESTSDSDSHHQSSASNHDFDRYGSDDDDHDLFLNLDDRFVDSGWGGECLRETEDIDFEFVYALHTFVATVEGQANATKGDTMVLLDDSNSYWWLVRVVKDSSIGMLELPQDL